MPTSSAGSHPDGQTSPSPESPPGAPSNTPIPASVLVSNPTNTPAGAEEVERFKKIFYYSSLGLMAVCPAVMLMPPRKVDPFTVGLGFAWAASTNYVVEQHTGQGILEHIGRRLPSASPNAAQEAARRREQPQGFQNADEKLWKGERKMDWVDKRKEREQEYLDDGRGYLGLIKDHVREAFGYKPEGEDDE